MILIIPHILSCPKCGRYTLKGQCPKCNVETVDPKPAKFSPDDKYGKYRRMAKAQMDTDD